jgi:hypothetical protein
MRRRWRITEEARGRFWISTAEALAGVATLQRNDKVKEPYVDEFATIVGPREAIFKIYVDAESRVRYSSNSTAAQRVPAERIYSTKNPE